AAGSSGDREPSRFRPLAPDLGIVGALDSLSSISHTASLANMVVATCATDHREENPQMAPIVDSIEINRRPEDVFAYMDDLGKHAEWQDQIVSTHVETDGPTHVGTRATDKRRLPGGTRDITYEITEHSPPHKSSF